MDSEMSMRPSMSSPVSGESSPLSEASMKETMGPPDTDNMDSAFADNAQDPSMSSSGDMSGDETVTDAESSPGKPPSTLTPEGALAMKNMEESEMSDDDMGEPMGEPIETPMTPPTPKPKKKKSTKRKKRQEKKCTCDLKINGENYTINIELKKSNKKKRKKSKKKDSDMPGDMPSDMSGDMPSEMMGGDWRRRRGATKKKKKSSKKKKKSRGRRTQRFRR